MGMQMDIGYVFSVVITGLTVVFLGLIILVLFVWLLGKIFDSFKNNPTKEEKVDVTKSVQKKPADSPVQSRAVFDGIDDEIAAVIAAAVAAMSDGDTVYSIRSIKKSGRHQRRTAWGMAGICQNTSQI